MPSPNRLKAFGLALVVGVALGALAVSPAQAEDSTRLTLDSIGKQIYKTAAGTEVTCSTIAGHAVVAEGGSDTNVTLTDIRYSECDASIGQKVTVDMEGCDYLFHGGEEDTANHFKSGTVDLVCPEGVTGPKITIWSSGSKRESEPTKPLCTLTVWNFTNRGEITRQHRPWRGNPQRLRPQSD